MARIFRTIRQTVECPSENRNIYPKGHFEKFKAPYRGEHLHAADATGNPWPTGLAIGQRMESSSIELPGSEIRAISHQDGSLCIDFSRAYIVKTMTGSYERTRWWQSGLLILEGAETRSEPLSGQLVCTGGDVDDNIFTYRDMIPVPLATRGHARCDLGFRGTDTRLIATGTALRLEMTGAPKYIEHVRPAD